MHALPFILITLSFSVQAKMYKWVDENGQMHFGDKIPPKYLVKEYDELNDQGIVMKHKEAAKTPEQIAEEKRLEEERKKAELEEKRKQQRDRVLLDTYTTERDLIVARDSRLDTVDSQIRLAASIIADSNHKIESMEKQVARLKASGREVPPDLFKRIDNQKRQVSVQYQVMESHKKRRDEIATQFTDYIERFKELKMEQKAKREALAKTRTEAL
jgi:chromosome segregation ATPase